MRLLLAACFTFTTTQPALACVNAMKEDQGLSSLEIAAIVLCLLAIMFFAGVHLISRGRS